MLRENQDMFLRIKALTEIFTQLLEDQLEGEEGTYFSVIINAHQAKPGSALIDGAGPQTTRKGGKTVGWLSTGDVVPFGSRSHYNISVFLPSGFTPRRKVSHES